MQGLLDSGELVCMTVRGLSPRQRAWIAWNDATCGLAGKWWRETLLANSAIFYNLSYGNRIDISTLKNYAYAMNFITSCQRR
ncbi:Hypothetical transcriptional regulator yeeY [Klebsiella pneumoniae IS46]|nr:Hypothetical transcriptional regulator yeeY [Klebsiella pneumoniae IS46]CDL61248.1 Hypothetical transcriptional regulator yeeY [Klebsiella pneumoniae IS39]